MYPRRRLNLGGSQVRYRCNRRSGCPGGNLTRPGCGRRQFNPAPGALAEVLFVLSPECPRRRFNPGVGGDGSLTPGPAGSPEPQFAPICAVRCFAFAPVCAGFQPNRERRTGGPRLRRFCVRPRRRRGFSSSSRQCAAPLHRPWVRAVRRRPGEWGWK